MNFLNECFDRVVLINMKTCLERLQVFRDRHPDLDFDVVPGYDEDDLLREGWVIPGTGPERRGFVGRTCCWLSHLRITHQCCCSGQRVLIFEDDAIIDTSRVEEITDCPEDVELLFLGCGLEGGPEQREEINGWYRLKSKGWFGTWAYGFTCFESQVRWLRHMLLVGQGVHVDTRLRSIGTDDIVKYRPAKNIVTHDYSFRSNTKKEP